MIPLRDDQPIFSTPFVNYFLIVLNVVVFLWELSVGMQSHRALNAFMVEFGVVPHHTLAVLTGHSYASLATAILPLFTSMFLHASFLHVAGTCFFCGYSATTSKTTLATSDIWCFIWPAEWQQAPRTFC